MKKYSKRFKGVRTNISSLASWVMNVSEQPLIIDSITIMGSQYKQKEFQLTFEKLWHEIILFFGSFRDVGDFEVLKVNGPTIEVWVGTGRDQTTILRQLIDESCDTTQY